jgi:hypothetical protein
VSDSLRPRRGRSAQQISRLLLSFSLAACTPELPGPADAAVELFLVAAERPLPAERIDSLFDLDAEDPRRVALLDALDLLRHAGQPTVVESQPLPDLQRTAVDLENRLDGGGVASYSVQLEHSGDRWIVRWFGGPGVEWPVAKRRRNQGLSSSAPPQAAPDREAGRN